MSHSNRLDNGVIVISNSDESGEVEFHFNDGSIAVYEWDQLRRADSGLREVAAKPCDQDHDNPKTIASFGRCVKCGATVRGE